MADNIPIITVGISPCWDIFCWAEGLDWGQHKQIQQQLYRPAGKALNVSRALQWMGLENTAMGLWGGEDYLQMKAESAKSLPNVKLRHTIVPGRTRVNINIIDSKNSREMHLRSPSELTTLSALKKLKQDLKKKFIKAMCVCLPVLCLGVATCRKSYG